MKVLTLTTSYPRFRGDYAGNFIHDLSAELVRKGIEVSVLAPHDTGTKDEETWDGVGVSRFHYFWPVGSQRLCYGGGMSENLSKSMLAKAQIPTYLVSLFFHSMFRCRDKDIVHAHWIVPQGIVGVFLKAFFGKKLIVSVHGSDIYLLDSPLGRPLARAVLRFSDAVTANSAATADAVRRIAGVGGVKVIPMGVDLDAFNARKDRSILAKHGLSGRVVLFVGRLQENKGVSYLLKAFKLVRARFPDASLLIVGEGPDGEALRREADSSGLGDCVVFAGNVEKAGVAAYYRAADVFVMPSVSGPKGAAEGLGVVLIEALASGVPSVASGVGGMTDIIKDGQTGLLVPEKNPEKLADAIGALLSDGGLRDRLSADGRAYVCERFGIGYVAGEFKEVMASILSAG
jgi:glycosyltransferase involved in cell wall biosynthesis